MRRQVLPRALFYVIFLALPLTSLFGQGFGSIQGTVGDPTGAVVPSVVVTATQTQTKVATTTTVNSKGLYVFPSLPPTTYSISVSAPGFEQYVENGIVLQANQALTANVILSIGRVSETVTVHAGANLVDTSTGTLSRVVDTQQVNELPLNGRNAAVLTELTAGANVGAPTDAADQGSTKTFPVVVNVSINGSTANQTDYMLDGGNNLDEYTNVNQPFPFPDAIQEFSVQTSNYNAEYGQNAGGVVNIVTKSGGSKFHGDVFEYIRNAAFNARDYFTPAGTGADPLKRNQYGATVGGPISIPHVLRGQHTFFFFGFQKTHLTDVANGKSSFVPTQAELAGDFSALCTTGFTAAGICTTASQQVADPINLTGGKPTPFPFNKVSPSRYDNAAVALDKVIPQATGTGLVVVGNPTINDYNEYFGRVDQDVRSKDHIFGHYYYDNFAAAGFFSPTNFLINSAVSRVNDQSALISESHIFSDKLLNNLVVNFSREYASREPPSGSIGPNSFGVNVYQPAPASIQGVSATGSFSIGVSQPALFSRENYSLGDDVHLVKGTHNLAFGAHAEISRVNINSTTSSGTYTFNSQNTNSAILSYLLGYMSAFTQTTGQRFSARNVYWGVYAQDSWRVGRKLVLNYGLRYEPFKPWAEKFHRFTIFDPVGYAAGRVSTVYPKAPAGLYFSGDAGVPVNGPPTLYGEVMPRFGFAYDLFGDGKTALRGGGGVFYDAREEAFNYADVTNNTPFTLSENLTYPAGPFSNPYLGITNPFPTPNVLASNTVFPQPVTADATPLVLPAPVTYDWNVTVEQSLTKNLGARIAYVGSDAMNIRTGDQLNPATYIPGSSNTGNTTARRRYQGFGSIRNPASGESSNYNSLQATLQQRTSYANFVVNYTWSKALSTSGLENGQPLTSYHVYPVYFPNYKALDYGPTDFDARQIFSASYVIHFPELRTGYSFVRATVNGWGTTGIVQARTGNSLTVISGIDESLTGIGQDRAQRVPGVNPYGSGRQYLNRAAFTQPATGTFGNVQKGSFVAPGYTDFDAGLFRNFTFHERFGAEFRAEYFNVLNHPNFTAPANSLSSSGFGTETADVANGFRIGQLALKLVF